MSKIKKCGECNTYTLEDKCPECGGETSSPGPPKFSFPDRHAEYRRETRKSGR